VAGAVTPVPFQFSDPYWPGLAKLMEECGEVVQVIGKIVGTGGTMEFRDGQHISRDRLVEEMADLRAALDFVADRALSVYEREAMRQRRNAKRELFELWRRQES
jgi:NTP pyrophosphatase (non-canonical NTP hydrolase)